MSASDLVKQWREKAVQKAAERAAESAVVEVTFGGFPGKARRLDLMSYARAGRMPQYLTAALFAAVQGKTTTKLRDESTPEELSEWLRFQAIVFCDMMMEPKFTTEEDRDGRKPGDGEMDYSEFVMDCPEVIKEGVQWQLDGCPNIPIQTETGVMSLAELETFRDGGGWLASVESFYSAEGEYWDTKPTPRIM